MAIVAIRSDFGAQELKFCHCFHCSPSVCNEVMGLDVMIIVLWMLSYKSTFSLPSFTFIKRLFGSSSLSAIRMLSSVYLRLLIFLPWCALHNLNKQGDNMHSSANPFPIWIQFIVPYPVLTVAPWSVYRFLREQVRWSDIPISLRIFLFPLALFIVMLPKAHLTSNSRMSGSWWAITSSWLYGPLRSFLFNLNFSNFPWVI